MTRDRTDWDALDRQRPPRVAVRPERVPAAAGYSPPPRPVPPPPDWRPPVVAPTAPPRELPPQDHAAIDQAEQRAARITNAIAAVAGVVLAVMFAVLCGQLLR